MESLFSFFISWIFAFSKLTNKKENKTIVLYNTNPNEVVAPFMVLYQLGFKNLKIAGINNSYDQNKLITKNIDVEKSVADINAFINESIKKAAKKPKPKPVIKAAPKKVIPIKDTKTNCR